jgi:hypothetical protein
MSAISVTVGGTSMPANIVSLKRSDELLWSEGTGRSASSGAMVGSVVAQKQTYTIEFGILSAAQYSTVRGVAGSGFVSLVISVNNSQLTSTTVYRGTTTGELLGVYGGTAYYKNVTLELVEK